MLKFHILQLIVPVFCDSLEMKNMIPAAKERLNLSKAEKWANERMPAMMPAKHAIPDRIINARVAFQYAGGTYKK